MSEFKRAAGELPRQTMRSIAFLTRLTVPDRFFRGVDEQQDLNTDAAAFPVAGVLIGVVPAVLLGLLSVLGAPAFLASAFATLALVGLTGALHEDGLGDTADGFGGGRSVEKRLEIMRDSRVGSYGAIAITGSLMLRMAALTAIVDLHGAFAAGLLLMAVAACSRAAMVRFWASLPAARLDGVSANAGAPSESVSRFAALSGLAIFAVVAIPSAGFANAAVALLFGTAALYGVRLLCQRMIGGQTGDTIGGCQQIVEIALLTGLAFRF